MITLWMDLFNVSVKVKPKRLKYSEGNKTVHMTSELL